MTSQKERTTEESSVDGVAKGDRGDALKTPPSNQPAPAPAAPGSTPAAQTTTPRRGPGAKEVPPFQWKLIGEAEGFKLTLFKSVEREDVEAQLGRVQREGYYQELRILTVDEKVPQAAAAKAKIKSVLETIAKKEVRMPKASRSAPARSAPARSAPTRSTAKTKKVAAAKKPKEATKHAASPKKTGKATKATKKKKKTQPAKSKSASKPVKASKKKSPAKSAKSVRTTTKKTTKKTAKKKRKQ